MTSPIPLRERLARAIKDELLCNEGVQWGSVDELVAYRTGVVLPALRDWLHTEVPRRVVSGAMREWFVVTDQNSEPVWRGGAELILSALADAIDKELNQ